MPNYFFHVRTPDRIEHLPQQYELSNLQQALVAAHGAARALIHRHAGRAPLKLAGSLDVEDERGQPVARLLLADVARQIS